MSQTTAHRARELPQTDPATARTNLRAEYVALVAVVDSLDPEQWGAPTDCTGWTVRHLVAHLAGGAECFARRRAMLRHYGYAALRSWRHPETFVDHMCVSQIAARDGMPHPELTADLCRWAADAPARVEAWPAWQRRLRLPAAAQLPAGATLATFLDVIPTRDVWLHRVDLARALGRPREVTAAEGEAVRQVIRDLDIEWGGPTVDLTLTGPGGGSWRLGDGEPVAHVTEDAVAYLRLLSGRSDECTPTADGGPDAGVEVGADGRAAAVDALRAARVAF